MRNHIQTGDNITVAAPYLVASGDPVEIGALFGVASTDANTNDDVAIATVGVFSLPKEAADNVAVGDRLYWDAANSVLTVVDTAGNLVGVAVQAAPAPAAEVAVKIG